MTIKTGVALTVLGTVLASVLGFAATTTIERVADHDRRIARLEAQSEAVIIKLDRIENKLDQAVERALKNAESAAKH